MGNLVKVGWKEDVTMEYSIQATVPDDLLDRLKNSSGKEKVEIIDIYTGKYPDKCDVFKDEAGAWPIEDHTVIFEVLDDDPE